VALFDSCVDGLGRRARLELLELADSLVLIVGGVNLVLSVGEFGWSDDTEPLLGAEIQNLDYSHSLKNQYTRTNNRHINSLTEIFPYNVHAGKASRVNALESQYSAQTEKTKTKRELCTKEVKNCTHSLAEDWLAAVRSTWLAPSKARTVSETCGPQERSSATTSSCIMFSTRLSLTARIASPGCKRWVWSAARKILL